MIFPKALRDPTPQDERWLLTCVVSAGFLLSGQPIGYNPDGLEMIALAKSWVGEGPVLEAGGYWPPLWPFLILLLSRLESPEIAGWLLNLLLAGLVVAPLHRITEVLAGRWAARLAVLLYALLPAVREHAGVLDARPLGTFLAVLAVSLAVDARDRRGWGLALMVAGLGALARPEGLLWLPLLVLGGILRGDSWKFLIPAGVLAGLPALLRPGASVRSWEAFTGPWLGIWPNNDLLALFGPNSAPTPYRAFVLKAEALGIETAPSLFQNLLLALPGGLELLKKGLPAATGGLGLVLALWGLLRIGQRGRREAALSVVGLGLFLPIVLLPMARDQATPATNFMFLLPGLCVLMGVALESGKGQRALAFGFAMLILGEAHLGPFRGEAPTFFEGIDAAMTMRDWLRAHPPPSGHVACRLSGRGVVVAAGLIPDPLPSSWEEWTAEKGVGVLLTTVDLRGADGGRGLETLEDPRWQVRALSWEGQAARWPAFLTAVREGQVPDRLLPSKHGLVYLEARE